MYVCLCVGVCVRVCEKRRLQLRKSDSSEQYPEGHPTTPPPPPGTWDLMSVLQETRV